MIKQEIRVDKYIEQMQAFANDSLSIDKLLVPFGIYTLTPESNGLMIGFIIDLLKEEKSEHDFIDIADILNLAQDLGAEGVDDFVKNAPTLLYQILKNEVANF